MFEVRPTDEQDAREFVAWAYSPPYEMYTMTPDDLAAISDPASGYYSVRDERGDLVAFLCFGPEAQVPGGDYAADALDVGCGIRPDLTGKGLGPAIIGLAVDVGSRRYRPRRFRATIAQFNRRAQRAAEKAGFAPVSDFRRPSDGLPFVILERSAGSDEGEQ